MWSPARAAPETLWEMHVLGLQGRLTELETLDIGSSSQCLNKPIRCFWCTAKFQSHCVRLLFPKVHVPHIKNTPKFLLKLQISRPYPRLAKSDILWGSMGIFFFNMSPRWFWWTYGSRTTWRIGVKTASDGTSACVEVIFEFLFPLLHDPGDLAGGTMNTQCQLALE